MTGGTTPTQPVTIYRDATIPELVVDPLRAWLDDETAVSIDVVRACVRDVVIRWDENTETEVDLSAVGPQEGGDDE